MVVKVRPLSETDCSWRSLKILLGWLSFVGIHLPVRPGTSQTVMGALAIAQGVFCFLLNVCCMTYVYYVEIEFLSIEKSATVVLAGKISHTNEVITTIIIHGSMLVNIVSRTKWHRFREAVNRVDDELGVQWDSCKKFRSASIAGLIFLLLMVSSGTT